MLSPSDPADSESRWLPPWKLGTSDAAAEDARPLGGRAEPNRRDDIADF